MQGFSKRIKYFKRIYRFNLYLKSDEYSLMVSLSELRACKSCGNVFTKRAGVTIITSCPHCDGTNFDTIIVNEELV